MFHEPILGSENLKTQRYHHPEITEQDIINQKK